MSKTNSSDTYKLKELLRVADYNVQEITSSKDSGLIRCEACVMGIKLGLWALKKLHFEFLAPTYVTILKAHVVDWTKVFQDSEEKEGHLWSMYLVLFFIM